MKSVSSGTKDCRTMLTLSHRLKSGEQRPGKDSDGCAGDRWGEWVNGGGGLFRRK